MRKENKFLSIHITTSIFNDFTFCSDHVDRYLYVCHRYERGGAGRGVLLHDLEGPR